MFISFYKFHIESLRSNIGGSRWDISLPRLCSEESLADLNIQRTICTESLIDLFNSIRITICVRFLVMAQQSHVILCWCWRVQTDCRLPERDVHTRKADQSFAHAWIASPQTLRHACIGTPSEFYMSTHMFPIYSAIRNPKVVGPSR